VKTKKSILKKKRRKECKLFENFFKISDLRKGGGGAAGGQHEKMVSRFVSGGKGGGRFPRYNGEKKVIWEGVTWAHRRRARFFYL